MSWMLSEALLACGLVYCRIGSSSSCATTDSISLFESNPVLYGSKPPTKTLSWMELPENMTYCLCYGSVAGQSAGIPGCPWQVINPKSSDRWKKASTQPHLDLPLLHLIDKERLVISLFSFGKIDLSVACFLLIHPIVESESSLILPIPLKELIRINKRDDILTDLSLDHLLPTLLAWPYPLLEWKHYAKSFFLFLTLLAGSRDYLTSGTTPFDY